MSAAITSPVLDAGDHNYRTLSGEQRGQMLDLLAAHGLNNEDIWTFRVEYAVIDCPLLRVWWLTRAEFEDLPDKAFDDILGCSHVSEIALRAPLPEWWRPVVEDM